MPLLPENRSEAVFPDKKPPYDEAQATVEANRCLFCFDAPCIQACPTSIDIPGFIRKIGTGNVRGAAKTILESNILGQSCARVCPVEVLCVGDCVYNELGVPPIQIGKLQRYATDAAVEEGWEFFNAGAPTGKRVACVGGGAASLAAAHRLRRFGHHVTIYESRSVLGGLNTTGIAPYKLPAEDAAAEAVRVLAIGGIDVKTGVTVGEDVSWDEVLRTHDAVFLGFGLGPDTRLGDMPPGAYGAVEWIERMKLETVNVSGVRRALVVGGGNTAIDAVRELLGLGVSRVMMVYRGTEDGMSGYVHEWTAAKQEGAIAAWKTAPLGFVTGADGRVNGLRAVKVDDAKQPVAGSEHVIDAELVLVAIGQSKLGNLVASLGVELDRGRIVTGPGGRTKHPKVFAGGDAANGGKEVVNAVAEGRDAAVAIHEMLAGGV
jgi:dihydropyrimidine dehydrogenase (NAD+) subunit PreT